MSNEELVIRIQNGIDTAENMLALWNQTKQFITMIAKRYTGYAELEDLEQEGYLALYKAVDGYDRMAGGSFINYASYWLHQGMRRYIENNALTIRLPVNEYAAVIKYEKAVGKFYEENGRKPTLIEIADYMGISLKRVEKIERNLLMKQTGSLDSTVLEDGDDTIGDTIPGNEDPEAEVLDSVQQETLKNVLWEIVDELPEEQKKVIYQRYRHGRNLKALGKSMGYNENHTRRIESKAMHNLYHSVNASVLGSFLNDYIGSSAYRHNSVGEFNRTWTSSTEKTAFKMLKA